jgi:hypothetical protein
MAFALLLGNFLIPVAITNLRGVTHVITCEADVRTPFTLTRENGGVTQASSMKLEPGEPVGERAPDNQLCGGLTVAMGTKPAPDPSRVILVLPITNHTLHTWEGSIAVRFDGVTVPVTIGEISPGGTATEEVTLRLRSGANELTGSILIGP